MNIPSFIYGKGNNIILKIIKISSNFIRFFEVKTLSYLFICNKHKGVNFKSYGPMNYVNFLEDNIANFCEYRLSQTLFLKNLNLNKTFSNYFEYLSKYLLIKLMWTSKFLVQIKIAFRNCSYKEEK